MGQLGVENKAFQRALALEKDLSFVNAIQVIETEVLVDKNISQDNLDLIKLRLANLYYLVKDFNKAEKYFAEGLLHAPVLKGEDLKYYLKYAQVLSSNGKPKDSAEIWKKYSDLNEQDKIAQKFIRLYSNLDPLLRNTSSYETEYIGINTGSSDFSPAYYKDGLVFVSGRDKKTGLKRVFTWDNSSFLDLYYLEDLAVLGGTSEASISAGNSSVASKSNLNKVGNTYVRSSTPNDNALVASYGSDYITGSRSFEERAVIETKKFSKTLNSKYHEGPCTFTKDFKQIVFTRNSLGTWKKDEINRLHLYIADKTEKDWSKVKEFPYNSDNYSTGHPSFGPNDDILFFVSDMPGGFGGTDIYYSKRDGEYWSEPINCGGKINTQGNEMFPFCDAQGNLYFSSDGHPGLGDLDIFYVQLNSLTLEPESVIRNLGAPINSSKDDFGIVTDENRLVGYFSSNRKRGGADDDIYKFKRNGSLYGCRDLILAVVNKHTGESLASASFEYFKIEDKVQLEKGFTNDKGNIKLCLEAESEFYFDFALEGYEPAKIFFSNLDASDFEPSELRIELVPLKKEEPIIEEEKPKERRVLVQKRNLSNQRLFKGIMYSGENEDPLAGVKIRFINKCNGQIQELYSKKDGSYEFERDPECDYELIAFKDDFATSFELIERSIDRNIFKKKVKVKSNYEGPRSLFDTKLYKVGDVVQMDNIYFDSDSWKIRSDAEDPLDDLIAILNRYPNMIIEVYSHTDTRGNAADNLYLSQKRAKEVENYIVKNGKISRNRIRAVGKGETEPVNDCSDGVQCTEAEHQRNRRTEFKILSIERIL